MSENVDSSEPAVEETASAPPTKAAQPEPISAPKKGDKKKMLMAVIAIIVVAALIGSAAYVFVFAGKKLEVTMTPDPIPNVAAGGVQALSVVVEYGGDVVEEDVTYSWSLEPLSLGDLDFWARANVQFEAGDAAGTGTVTCEVTYDGKTKSVEAAIEVNPPFLDSVNILPSYAIIVPDEEQVFNATAIDSVGGEVTGATMSWSVSGVSVGDYTLNSTSGSSVTFSASVETVVTLTATATNGSESASGTATANVTLDVLPRTVDYVWYDMFAHELGPWYEDRDLNYGDEYAITDEYPYLYIWEGAPPGNVWIYTMMRLEMTGLNMPELNMNENPEFLPYLGTARGGNAELDWYMNYLTRDDGVEKLSPGAYAWYDGWFVAWNGTITLDRQAAKAVLGISDTGLDDFDTWWTANQGDIKEAWESWLNYEAGNDRLAIYAAYEYDLTFVFFEMVAEMVGDEVVIEFDTISWGIEALMFRWMAEAWMPTEWYMEDMYLTAEIGPTMADVYLDTAVGYALYAYAATDPEGVPCWAWEALIQDYVESSTEYPISMYDPYVEFEYLNLAPGSGWYDTEMTYDYAPGTWDLEENETLTLEWPEDEVLFFLHSPGSDGVIEDIGIRDVPDTINYMANMTCVYAEPMWTDDADVVSVDYDANQILYEGPFDMYTWSMEQDAHEWLASEWDRLDILPYGIPFVEFCADVGEEPVPDLLVEDIRSPLTIGESSSFNVTIFNALTMDVIEDYAGTITFDSSDPAAVIPDDYTFVPATDMGTHEFTVVFNTVDSVTHDAVHYVTAYDVDDNTISGTQDEIDVWEPAAIDHFVVTFSGDDVIATEETTATITAYNQWDDVHTSYEGTVVFDSDDTGATLPGPTAFTDAMDGVQDVAMTYSTPGLHTLNVTDQDVTEASGESSVTVLAAPVADHFLLTGVDDPAEVDTDQTMTVTVYDQYDRAFMAYDGTVEFETNRTGEVTLPGDETFTLGDPAVDVVIHFTAEGYFTVWCNDTTDSSTTGMLEAWIVGEMPAIDHFTVTGIEDMWENNYSSVTVTAYDQYDTVFEDYVGEVSFDTDAPGLYELPADYTFTPADAGVAEFQDSVMFDEPGTYEVDVEDTSDGTKTGAQMDIVIEDLVADYFVVEGPASAMSTDPFSITVTVYHKYGEVHEEYLGTVEFSGGGAGAILPDDYTFVPATDMGTHEFTDAVTLDEVGAQTVTVNDQSVPSIIGALEVDVTPFVTSDLTYRIYDLFEEPQGDWWLKRPYGAWDTDRLLTADSGEVTELYSVWGVPKGSTDDQGMIYAPYRWNITGTDLPNPNINVHEPTMMPKIGTDVPGAEASMYIYFQYGSQDWWDSYWVPEWGDHPDWGDWEDLLTNFDDGWYAYTVYDIDMNHEAAEEWLGLDASDDPETWWAANEATYVEDWDTWILDQGNNVFDIFCAYDYAYGIMSTTMMRLSGDLSDVHMEIAHVSWGYEMLMTRWLDYTDLSNHQVYFEDFGMVLDLREDEVDIEMDAVCQWSMHAVKQNESAPGDNTPCAWVWEPVEADYLYEGDDHPSAYEPYDPATGDLRYHSWNCGDPNYDTEVGYGETPLAFELPAYAKLVVELPSGSDVIGYYAEPVPEDALKRAWESTPDLTIYDDLRYYGEMDMGYCELGGADWDYDDGNKILTIEGPWFFTNPHPSDPSWNYHGAPWLEFNVNPVAKAASAAQVVSDGASGVGAVTPEEQLSASASASTASEIVSLAATMCAVLVLIAALVIEAGRRREEF